MHSQDWWKSLFASIDSKDTAGFLDFLTEDAEFRFEMDPADGSMLNRVFIDGGEETEAIRAPEISALASPVSALSGVRRALVAKQKQMGRDGAVVMEGRDIGTVVLPGAEVKIFLTASPEVRARRRHLELQEKGIDSDLDGVLGAIRERDHRDSTRADSPLVPAHDSVAVDTDNLTIEQVVDRICEIVKEKTGESPVSS